MSICSIDRVYFPARDVSLSIYIYHRYRFLSLLYIYINMDRLIQRGRFNSEYVKYIFEWYVCSFHDHIRSDHCCRMADIYIYIYILWRDDVKFQITTIRYACWKTTLHVSISKSTIVHSIASSIDRQNWPIMILKTQSWVSINSRLKQQLEPTQYRYTRCRP